VLRSFSDAEYERFIHYMQSSIHLVLDVMQSEKTARLGKAATPADKTDKARNAPKKTPPRKRKRAPAAARRPRS
jgi:hypothetical protein